MPAYDDGAGPLDDQIWLFINGGCQFDVSNLLPVPERQKVMKAVIKAWKRARGEAVYDAEDLANSGAVGLAKMG
jgi:hypothetical protein